MCATDRRAPLKLVRERLFVEEHPRAVAGAGACGTLGVGFGVDVGAAGGGSGWGGDSGRAWAYSRFEAGVQAQILVWTIIGHTK